MQLDPDHPLAPLTTLELGGTAQCFARIERVDDLIEALRVAPGPQRILGGGSNLLIADAGVQGSVLQLATRGIALERGSGDDVVVTAQAGEPFQDLVEATLDADLAGIECLTGIPGCVGATPIQNVGAYGQEIADTLEAVQVLERGSGQIRWLTHADCEFGYRDSLFKRAPGRFVVLQVRLRLRRGGAPALRYAELLRSFDTARATPGLRDVASRVWALRASKSMVVCADDENRRSAGSFFTNPVVSAARCADVLRVALRDGHAERPDQVPQFPAAGGGVKLSAGWLIERSGFHKGMRRGAVGISTKHALALVHHGGGSTAEMLALADEVRGGVHERFGISLEREPTLWE